MIETQWKKITKRKPLKKNALEEDDEVGEDEIVFESMRVKAKKKLRKQKEYQETLDRQRKLKEFLQRIELKDEESDMDASLRSNAHWPPADKLFMNLFNVYAKEAAHSNS